LNFRLGWPGSQSSYLLLPLAGMTGTEHHTQRPCWKEVSLIFCLPISISWVTRIAGMSHLPWLILDYFNSARKSMQHLVWQNILIFVMCHAHRHFLY
jgi:hypothetical protein